MFISRFPFHTAGVKSEGPILVYCHTKWQLTTYGMGSPNLMENLGCIAKFGIFLLLWLVLTWLALVQMGSADFNRAARVLVQSASMVDGHKMSRGGQAKLGWLWVAKTRCCGLIPPEPCIGVPSAVFTILQTTPLQAIYSLNAKVIWKGANPSPRFLSRFWGLNSCKRHLFRLLLSLASIIREESLMPQLPSKTFNLFLAIVIRLAVWYCWHASCGRRQFALTDSIIRNVEFSWCKCSSDSTDTGLQETAISSRYSGHFVFTRVTCIK